jgi:hypothetical protein
MSIIYKVTCTIRTDEPDVEREDAQGCREIRRRRRCHDALSFRHVRLASLSVLNVDLGSEPAPTWQRDAGSSLKGPGFVWILFPNTVSLALVLRARRVCVAADHAIRFPASLSNCPPGSFPPTSLGGCRTDCGHQTFSRPSQRPALSSHTHSTGSLKGRQPVHFLYREGLKQTVESNFHCLIQRPLFSSAFSNPNRPLMAPSHPPKTFFVGTLPCSRVHLKSDRPTPAFCR